MDNGGSEVLNYKVWFENQAGHLTSITVEAETMWQFQELLVSMRGRYNILDVISSFRGETNRL